MIKFAPSQYFYEARDTTSYRLRLALWKRLVS